MARRPGSAKGLDVTGDFALDVKLKAMTGKLQLKLGRKATRKSIKEIALPQAKRDAPRDTQGRIARALVIRSLKRSRSRLGHTLGLRKGSFDPGNYWPYALEYGTKERHLKSGKGVGAIPKGKFAFMRKAIYDNRRRIEACFVKAIKEAIRDERAKGNTK